MGVLQYSERKSKSAWDGQLFLGEDPKKALITKKLTDQFRVDFLWDWLVWSSCSPRQFRESSPAPQFEGISFPGKNTGVGFHFLLQGIFLTEGSNPHLLHWQADSSPPHHLGSPYNWQNQQKQPLSLRSLQYHSLWRTKKLAIIRLIPVSYL